VLSLPAGPKAQQSPARDIKELMREEYLSTLTMEAIFPSEMLVYFNGRHSVMPQKRELFIAVKTSKPPYNVSNLKIMN
jgi:hypothetical protein